MQLPHWDVYPSSALPLSLGVAWNIQLLPHATLTTGDLRISPPSAEDAVRG